MRGATVPLVGSCEKDYISIHAPLAGCDEWAGFTTVGQCISIHAPLAGCDVRPSDHAGAAACISIHAPLAGCDALKSCRRTAASLFQSTHPLRGATAQMGVLYLYAEFQSTHPLRGATRPELHEPAPEGISIHAPLAGCDRRISNGSSSACDFNPRTPCGVRLELRDYQEDLFEFQSTHPLRGATARPTPCAS